MRPSSELDLVDEFYPLSGLLQAMLDEERDVPEDRNAWMEAATIARYFTDIAMQSPESEDFGAFAETLERLLNCYREEWVRSWIKVGIIETMQNLIANHRTSHFPNDVEFRERLGPLSRSAWDEVHNDWGTGV
jgi:hypothetical protein